MLDTLRGFWFIILVLMKNNKGVDTGEHEAEREQPPSFITHLAQNATFVSPVP